MRREYTERDKVLLLGMFPSNYSTVYKYSQMPELTYGQLAEQGGASKVIAEFAAASGLPSLNFPILKEVISFVDGYLNTGVLQEDKMKDVRKKITAEFKPLLDVIGDYQKAGVANENGEGAPLVLFVPAYAGGLLLACDMIDKTLSGWDKTRILKLCNERKLRAPDDDPPRRTYG
ncbi:MAG TPA: hypothetical protein VIN59_05815 [Alphaproteobacteria bacterium]